VVGVVRDLRERQNKEKGTRFGFFALEDLSGSVEVICWAAGPGRETGRRSGAGPTGRCW
jgi:DNA polymerase-3 subunit alpha